MPFEILAVRVPLTADAVHAATELLSPDELQRAKRIVTESGHAQYAVCRAMLRCLLGDRLGIAPADIEIATTARGKPKLGEQHGGERLHFNASHCQDVAVFGFAKTFELGVDVEFVRDLPNAGDIARRFFSPREYEAYLALDESARPLGFFNCWTRKEAFVKAIGQGLYFPLDSFDMALAPDAPPQMLRAPDGHDNAWTVLSFRPFDGCVAAAVVKTD